jgi:hypothetical protein
MMGYPTTTLNSIGKQATRAVAIIELFNLDEIALQQEVDELCVIHAI